MIQRVKKAEVSVKNEMIASISQGLLIFIGFHKEDTSSSFHKSIKKVVSLRIFADREGKMNRNVVDVEGEILVVSQFTLYANNQSGNRPSFFESAPPDRAIDLYNSWCKQLEEQFQPTKKGIFGADMQVDLINDGPVTIWLDYPPANDSL